MNASASINFQGTSFVARKHNQNFKHMKNNQHTIDLVILCIFNIHFFWTHLDAYMGQRPLRPGASLSTRCGTKAPVSTILCPGPGRLGFGLGGNQAGGRGGGVAYA